VRIGLRLITVLGLLFLSALLVQAAALKPGDRGQQVLLLQENLAQLGFFKAAPTGYYGSITTAAVKSFQRSMSLTIDGIAGGKTIAAIQRALENHDSSRRGGSGIVAMLQWDVVNQLWRNGTDARVYDIETGLSFLSRRLYGSCHADVEPVTKYDTYIMRRIYGGSWSWSRRAVVVEYGGRYLAGSMNGMPHGHQAIYDNDFQGQFCIHFLGSRLHKNRQVDRVHQAMVLKAARTGLSGVASPADLDRVEEPSGSGEEREAATAAPAGVE